MLESDVTSRTGLTKDRVKFICLLVVDEILPHTSINKLIGEYPKWKTVYAQVCNTYILSGTDGTPLMEPNDDIKFGLVPYE